MVRLFVNVSKTAYLSRILRPQVRGRSSASALITVA